MAIQAAAKHPCNPQAADLEYHRLVCLGQGLDPDKAGPEDRERAAQELRDLLPAFRHPVVTPHAERIIFFADFRIWGGGGEWPKPDWYKRLEKIPEVERSLLAEVSTYAANLYFERLELKRELDTLKEKLAEAKEVYAPQLPGEDSGQRAKMVVNFLGFTGKRGESPFDNRKAYELYVYLIRHQGLSREIASEKVHTEFGGSSLQGTRKRLAKVKREVVRTWQKEDPEIFTKNNLAERFKKLTPW